MFCVCTFVLFVQTEAFILIPATTWWWFYPNLVYFIKNSFDSGRDVWLTQVYGFK